MRNQYVNVMLALAGAILWTGACSSVNRDKGPSDGGGGTGGQAGATTGQAGSRAGSTGSGTTGTGGKGGSGQAGSGGNAGTTGGGGGSTTGTGGARDGGTTGSGGSGTGGATTGTGGAGTGGATTGTGGAGTGGATTGTGGTGTGGSAGSGGQAGTGMPPGDGGTQNNYVVSGSWHGYAWTYSPMPSTFNPQNFESLTTPGPFCVTGLVAAQPSATAAAQFGLIAVNLNQAMVARGSTSPAMTATPTLDGVVINLTNRAVSGNAAGANGTLLQVQIQNQSVMPAQQWCKFITSPPAGQAGDVFIAWSDFNTNCMPAPDATFSTCSTGAAYNRQPITDIAIKIPANQNVQRPYDVCLNSLRASATVAAPMNAGAGTFVGPGDWAPVQKGGKNYVVQNNIWGTAGSNSQTVTFGLNNDPTSFNVTAFTGGPGANSSPASYPSVFIGSNNCRTTAGWGLPKAVSSIQAGTITSTWTHNATGDVNASFDIWFGAANESPAITVPSAGYAMIWPYQPGGRQPNGTMQGTATVGGQSYVIWGGTQVPPTGGAAKPCISYVMSSSQTNLTNLDVGAVIRDAATRIVDCGRGANLPCIDPGSYLTNIFAGFEIWSGGAGRQSSNFALTVN
jgi:hypothetical protein